MKFDKKYLLLVITIFIVTFSFSYFSDFTWQILTVANETTTTTTTVTTTTAPKNKTIISGFVDTSEISTTSKTTTSVKDEFSTKVTTTVTKISGGGSSRKGTTTVVTTIKPVAKIKINEIMYNPVGSDTGNEWIEIYNNDTFDCDILDWKFYEGGTNHRLTFNGSQIIPFLEYAIISNNLDNFLVNYPDFNGTLIYSSFSLSNTGEEIALKDYSSKVVDNVTYNSSWGGDGNNKTLERIGNEWNESLVLDGTPGFENSILNTTNLTSNTTSTTTTSTTSSTTTTTIPTLADHVVISEVQTGDEEFVELYNPTDTDVNMTGWYFSYFSSGKAWNDSNRNKKFPDDSIIKAYGFYLIGLKDYPIPVSDWQPYSSAQLSNLNGSVAVFPFDPKTKTVEDAKAGKIDALGWGYPENVYENVSSVAPESGKSLERKPGYSNSTAGNGWDTDDNLEDFIIRDTPEPQNSTYSELPF